MITTKTNLNQSNKTEKFEKKNHLNSIWFVWVDPFLTSFSFWSKQSNIPYKLSLSFLGISLTDMIRRCPSSKLHYWSRINDGLKLLIFNQMGPQKLIQTCGFSNISQVFMDWQCDGASGFSLHRTEADQRLILWSCSTSEEWFPGGYIGQGRLIFIAENTRYVWWLET